MKPGPVEQSKPRITKTYMSVVTLLKDVVVVVVGRRLLGHRILSAENRVRSDVVWSVNVSWRDDDVTWRQLAVARLWLCVDKWRFGGVVVWRTFKVVCCHSDASRMNRRLQRGRGRWVNQARRRGPWGSDGKWGQGPDHFCFFLDGGVDRFRLHLRALGNRRWWWWWRPETNF